MKLLFVTQKLTSQDAFGVLWVREFIRQGFLVTVLCLEGPQETFEFPVLSLGKEKGASRLQSAWTFQKLIMKEQYDRVFIHMSPVWYALGFWWWTMKRIPTYLWYTHYKMQLGVRLFGWFGTRFFCATPQSLPQYPSSFASANSSGQAPPSFASANSSGQVKTKKIVVGHGIDLSFWPRRRNISNNPYRLLVVHRLSRSKRLEIILRALTLLDPRYTIDIYGIEAEKEYVAELQKLVEDLKIGTRVTFHGTTPMRTLPEIYVKHRLILNMASETIDKTMLEAMTCGCYPVTTKANAAAIGITRAPETDTPESIAAFIRDYDAGVPMSPEEMYALVEKKHSLHGLVETMGGYIRAGT